MPTRRSVRPVPSVTIPVAPPVERDAPTPGAEPGERVSGVCVHGEIPAICCQRHDPACSCIICEWTAFVDWRLDARRALAPECVERMIGRRAVN